MRTAIGNLPKSNLPAGYADAISIVVVSYATWHRGAHLAHPIPPLHAAVRNISLPRWGTKHPRHATRSNLSSSMRTTSNDDGLSSSLNAMHLSITSSSAAYAG
mmetsp:Transcript_2308/g.5685  ORF Transcript_2308/g.5685 Transcript_2308/m.5685 type:complete len:103 (-) Transcript_2308:345-653(-)